MSKKKKKKQEGKEPSLEIIQIIIIKCTRKRTVIGNNPDHNNSIAMKKYSSISVHNINMYIESSRHVIFFKIKYK